MIRQCKYLYNIGAGPSRGQAITRPVQGFKDFRCARIILGVELMDMIRKGQMRDDGRGLSAAQRFYTLAIKGTPAIILVDSHQSPSAADWT